MKRKIQSHLLLGCETIKFYYSSFSLSYSRSCLLIHTPKSQCATGTEMSFRMTKTTNAVFHITFSSSQPVHIYSVKVQRDEDTLQ